MTINTPAQKSLQLAEVARTGMPAAEGAAHRAFYRYVAQVELPRQAEDGTEAGALFCEHATRNGHMVTETAIKCGQKLAESEMAKMPEGVDFDAMLTAVAITIRPVPRYLGVKTDGTDCGCTFGHKTTSQAEACSRGARAGAGGRTRRAARVAIPVTTGTPMVRQGDVPAAATTTVQATPEPVTTVITDTPAPTTPNQAKPASRKLRSGSTGNANRA